MISIWILFAILLIHWFADFAAQSDEQAKGKSSSWKYLLEHTVFYSFIWAPFAILLFGLNGLFGVLLCFIFHTATDYVTSRIVKHYFAKNDHHTGFVVIGFDQILHYIQLVLTYKLLSTM